MTELPSGTLTFLFTDLEGSTALWEHDAEVMREAVARHDELLTDVVHGGGGWLVKTTGDGIVAVFEHASDAVAVALGCQQALAGEDWAVPIRARMGLYSGEASPVDGDYHAPVLNRAARVMSAGHGGQVLVAASTSGLIHGVLSDGVELVDLGEYRLRDLGRPERLFQLTHSDLRVDFPPLRTLDVLPGNLPMQPSSFVGRDELLATVIDATVRSRLVTLIGVGGVGKTRLALQAAAEIAPQYRGGVWLVELASVRNPERVPDAVASVFGLSVRRGLSLAESLVAFLRDEDLLLVLDNCEHLLRPVAELVAAIEAACAGVVVLVTTREGLGIAGEQLLVVPPLQIPSPDHDPAAVDQGGAVQLFVDRAQARRADFAVDDTNRAAVVELCRRLDGVPLAIELAAARIAMMNPAEIVDHLDRRFRLLAGGDRVGIERHQTLRAAVDWSYEMLTDAEQQLLNRLSVFAGGWTLPAAAPVCAGAPIEADDVLELLSSLVARSLVVAEPGLQTRYRLLETIRQYAEEHLARTGDTDHWRTRHLHHYTRFLAELRPQLHGPDQFEVGARITREHDNLIAAMAHALHTSDVDQAMKLLALHSGWEVPGEILYLDATPILALPGAREHPNAPSALARLGTLALGRGDRGKAVEMLEQAKALEQALPEVELRDWLPVMYLQLNLSIETGDIEETMSYLDELAEHIGTSDLPESMQAWVLAAKAQLIRNGDPAAAIGSATDALAIARRSGMPTVVSMALCALADALAATEPKRAIELLTEAHALGGDSVASASGIAFVAARLDQWPLALRTGSKYLQLERRAAVMASFIHSGILSVIARGLAPHDPEGATVVLGAAKAVTITDRSESRTSRSATARPNEFGAIIAEARRQARAMTSASLGEDRVRELRHDGETMDRDRATTYTLARIDRLAATAQTNLG